MVESDAELVQRVLEGDIVAFEILVHRYERSVQSVAMAFLADMHASEDVVQETFVAAFRSLASLRHGNKFAPWLMQIARRTARKSGRKHKQVHVATPLEELSAPRSRAEDPRSQQLLEAIERLPEQERMTITMRFFDGHSSREIGLMTGHSVGTVTKQLSRAYDRLRLWLAEHEE